MNRTFTSKTYGDVRYVVEDGNYLYFPKDVVYGLGRDGVTFGGRDMTDIRKAGLYREATFGNRKKPQWALDLEGVKFFRDRKLPKKKKERAAAFFEWLQAQEESARNGAPYIPAPAKKEQPTEQGDCIYNFGEYIKNLARSKERYEQTISVCSRIHTAAIDWRNTCTDLQVRCDELERNLKIEREKNAKLSTVAEKYKAGNVTEKVKHIAKLRVLLGDERLRKYENAYYNQYRSELQYKELYTPTQIGEFVRDMSICDNCRSPQVVNNKLIEAAYQVQNNTSGEARYKLTDLLDDSYAYVVTTKGNNGADIPTLQWTKKGLALFIGLLLDTEAIEGTCI